MRSAALANDAVPSDTITKLQLKMIWKINCVIVESFLTVKKCSTINTIATTYLKIW